MVARIVGQRLTEQMGQPIIIEAKPGAGGAIAVNELMRSEPDGYTLLIATSTHATLPILANLSWHPSNDFTPIAAVYSYPFALVTNSENVSHFRTLAEFLAYARMNPGKINWGSSGTGGPQHLAGEHFMKLANIKMVHIPYRGNGPMMQALRANEVQVIFDTQTLVLPHIEEGRMTALAISATKRSAKLPNVPTIRETGLVDFAIEITNFVLGAEGASGADPGRAEQADRNGAREQGGARPAAGVRAHRPGGAREHAAERQAPHRRLCGDLRRDRHRARPQIELRAGAGRRSLSNRVLRHAAGIAALLREPTTQRTNERAMTERPMPERADD